MSNIELLLISIGLAMDAFAVAVCKGLAMKKFELKNVLKVGIYFGVFQALMPTFGYVLGKNFENLIVSIDHWIAFILLLILGINMIRETFKDEEVNDNFDIKTMIPLAIATSIDALAIGITFAFLRVNIFEAVLLIGIITMVMSFLGCIIGKKFGDKFEKKAQILGGIILILIGVKILLEHLGIINI